MEIDKKDRRETDTSRICVLYTSPRLITEVEKIASVRHYTGSCESIVRAKHKQSDSDFLHTVVARLGQGESPARGSPARVCKIHLSPRRGILVPTCEFDWKKVFVGVDIRIWYKFIYYFCQDKLRTFSAIQVQRFFIDK